MISPDYKKLSGSGRRFDGARFIGGVSKRTRLYLGPDHLLAVETAGFTEDYKRFYYRDIQALIVKETPRRSVWGLVLGILTVLELVGALAIGAAAAYVVFGSLVFITLTLFVVNQIMGPTCDTFLKTAVQVEPLPSLHRVKSAEKAFSLLKPRIVEAQQGFSTEEGRSTLEDLSVREGESSRLVQAPLSHLATTAPQLKPCGTRVHTILFSLLLCDVLLDVIQIFANSMLTVSLNTILTLGIIFLAIFALIKQHGTDLHPAIRRVTWIVIVYLAVFSIAGEISSSISDAQNGQRHSTLLSMMEQEAQIDPFTSPWYMGSMIVDAIFAVVLGGVGLFLIHGKRKAAIEPPTASAPPVVPVPPMIPAQFPNVPPVSSMPPVPPPDVAPPPFDSH